MYTTATATAAAAQPPIATTIPQPPKAKPTRFKDMVAESVNKRLKKYMNAGKIASSEDFRHLARKLTHVCVEKERRLHASQEDGGGLTVTKEVKKKISKLVDSFFEKLGGDVYRPSSSHT